MRLVASIVLAGIILLELYAAGEALTSRGLLKTHLALLTAVVVVCLIVLLR